MLAFEGDRHSGFRMVRATKNRFGPADEVGCFEMVDAGIVEVPDPSGLFTSQHGEPVPGTCVTVTMEGRRPLLAEVQALVVADRRCRSRGASCTASNLAGSPWCSRCWSGAAAYALDDRDVYVVNSRRGQGERPGGRSGGGAGGRIRSTEQAGAATLVALGEVGLAGELAPGAWHRAADSPRPHGSASPRR